MYLMHVSMVIEIRMQTFLYIIIPILLFFFFLNENFAKNIITHNFYN